MDFRWKPTPLQLTPVTRTAVQPVVQQPGILAAPDVHDEYRMAEAMGNTTVPQVTKALADEAARKDALLAEYRSNEARIKELEQKLSAAMSSGKANDELDLKLARNRAEAGDISNAFAHLNRIDTRRMQGMKNSTDGKLAGIVENLENAYIMRNSEKDAAAQAGWDNKIRRLSKEYENLTGKPYGYTGAQVDTANHAVSGTVENVMQYNNKLANLKAMRKDGRLTEAQLDELAIDVAGLPNGAEKNAAIEEIRKLRNDSVEKHDRAAASAKSKVNKAMAELERDWATQKVKRELKNPGKSVTRTVNGVTFTITYTGKDANGLKKYEISHNGKLKKVVKE